MHSPAPSPVLATLLHCSDLHFGRAFQPHVAERLLHKVEALNPGAVIVSGDLTMRARAHQFHEAREYLKQIRRPMLLIPGNHDVPLYDLVARFTKPFGNYTKYTADLSQNPIQLNGVGIFGINSVNPRRHQKGHFTHEHLHAVSRWLGDLPARSWRFVVTHQHFVVIPGYFRPGSIKNAERVLHELSQGGVHGILSGHMHFNYVGSTRDFFPHLRRPIALVHAGTATSGRLRGHESVRGLSHVNNFIFVEFTQDDFRVSPYDWSDEDDDFVRAETTVYDRPFFGDKTEPHDSHAPGPEPLLPE